MISVYTKNIKLKIKFFIQNPQKEKAIAPPTTKSDRCLFYAHDPHLVCWEHPEGVGSDCLDFRANPKIQEEEQWSPEGYFWYDGELREIRTSQLTSEQKLEILDTHPFFTGQCPSCGNEFDRANLPMIHWDCPSCGWVDESV